MRRSTAILLASWALAVSAHAQGFKFSDPSPEAQAEAAAQSQLTIDWQISSTTAAQRMPDPTRKRDLPEARADLTAAPRSRV